MSLSRWLTLLVCLLAVCRPAAAAAPPDAVAVASRFMDAWNNRDVPTLAAMSTMNAEVVTPYGELVPVSRLRDYFSDNETPALHMRVDVAGLAVQEYPPDAAVARTSVTVPSMRSRYRENNPSFGTHTSCSLFLVREQGTWKVAQLDVPLNEFTNPYVAATGKAREWSGTGGLLVGFLLALIFTRRRS